MQKAAIEEGDHVIFRREGSSGSKVFQIRKNRTVYYEKNKFSVGELLGASYGSRFELDKGKLSKMEVLSTEVDIGAANLDQQADNRNLLDTDKNQKMSEEDIMKMKYEGITGEKIIEELIENSETFKTKTEFSQAKYLKKKKKKHILIFTVHRPTPRLMMDIYAKEPGKICFLRPDSLSQLLCFSNVMHDSRVVVIESCQGLVLASVLQRMGGEGKLIQLIPSSTNTVCRLVMDYFSFPKEQLANVYSYPLDQLYLLSKEDEITLTDSTDSSKQTTDLQSPIAGINKVCEEGSTSAETKSTMEHSEKGVDKLEKMDCVEEEVAKNLVADYDCQSTKAQNEKAVFLKNRDLQKQERVLRQKEAGDFIRNKQLDSLIIACKQNPVPVLKRMLYFIPPSRPVVVYSQFIDPLVECYTYVKEKHLGIQLRLSETWFREYQVLPQRTHPTVKMSGTGGYILTFLATRPSLPEG